MDRTAAEIERELEEYVASLGAPPKRTAGRPRLERPRQYLHIRLDPAMLAKIDRECERSGKTRTKVLEAAVKAHLARTEAKEVL